MYRLAAVLLLVSPSLYAHTGSTIEHSVLSGLLHPLTGIDHLLVLMAVGLCAAKQGGKALLLFPLLFLALMAVGAMMSVAAVDIPFLESFITASILVFGVLVSVNHKPLAKIFFVCASFFAVFHGYAHAAEIPNDSSVVLYFSALLLSSAGVCLGSSFLGHYTGKRAHLSFSLACLSAGLYYLAAV